MANAHENLFLYEEISATLEESILQKNFQIGDKLPSVRLLSKQYGVSASTIFQAYYRLEAKGLVEARPKSGYYVRHQPTVKIPIHPVHESQPNLHNINTDRILDEMEELRNSETVTRLSNAIPDVSLLPTAKLNKSVAEILRMQGNQLLDYAPVQGNEALRKAIARQMIAWGGNYQESDILITNGCIEALNLCIRAVCKAGDIVAVNELTYFGIHQSIESLGLQVVAIPQAGLEGLDLNFLEKALQKFPIKACIFVLNFHNPTGTCMSNASKQSLYELLRRYEIPLIEDDIYGELYFGKKRPGNVKNFDQEGLVMYCSSFSKTLSPGYRVGYCLPGRFLSRLIHEKRIYSSSVSSLAQATIAHFLKTGRFEYHLRKLRNALHAQQIFYTKLILQYFPEEVEFSQPSGGLVFWLKFPEGFNGYELFLRAREARLSIVPGQIFSVSGTHQNYIRLSFANPPTPKIEEGFQKLGKLVLLMLRE
ncbi:MAG: PLP-dependent aminotransferase family protein [Microscillaceae bacterium]|nr:PLP-dependent aminotransferase family protein [Microscillaceae bacterium]